MTALLQPIFDRVLALVRVEPADIAKAIGVPLKLVDQSAPMEYYEGTFPSGALETADFRLNRKTGLAILVVKPRASETVVESQVDLTRYGPIVEISSNPRMAPEGVDAIDFDVFGVRLAFQFTRTSRKLYSVSFQWPKLPGAG